MGNEIPSRVSLEQMLRAWNIQPYQRISSTDEIAAIMQALTNIGVGYLSLISITLEFVFDGRKQRGQKQQIGQSAIHFLEHLRSLVRKTDIVFIQQTTYYFLLPNCALEGAEIVQARLWDALLWRIHSTGDLEIVRPSNILLGYSATLTSIESFLPCIEAAGEPLRQLERPAEKVACKIPARQLKIPAAAQDHELPQLARTLGIPYLSLLPRQLPIQVLRLIDPKLAQELRCYPLGRNKDVLTVAIANPQDRSALVRLEQATGLHIFPVLAPPLELQTALEQLI